MRFESSMDMHRVSNRGQSRNENDGNGQYILFFIRNDYLS